jgi:hypothetical protein
LEKEKAMKKLILRHQDRGILLMIPCKEDHNHSACWVFEADVKPSERFDKQPVVFKSKKECLKYGQFLCSLNYDLFNDKLEFFEQSLQ